MHTSRRLASSVAILCFFFPLVGAHSQVYTTIVAFGDSLSDTGNDANLSQAKYGLRIPGPIANYTDGRFTDGVSTIPGSGTYNGTWVEQLAAQLPNHPAVVNSLNGGTNYAYGFAFTGSGSTNLVLTTNPFPLSITVNNIGLQISTYLATHPRIDNKTLFVLWGGANDVLNATSATDIVNAATNQSINVYKLLAAGATQIIVPNLPPLGSTPRLNGSTATSIPYNQAANYFNKTLAQGIAIIEGYFTGTHPAVYQFDVYSLFNQVIASPATYGFTNVTASSQQQSVNPDQYLFWDSLHPTTHGHNIIANVALQVLNAPPCNPAQTVCPGSTVAH